MWDFIAQYCCMFCWNVILTIKSCDSSRSELYLCDWSTIFPDVCGDVGDVQVFDVQLPEVGELPELNRKLLDSWITAETGSIKIKATLVQTQHHHILRVSQAGSRRDEQALFILHISLTFAALDFHPHSENSCWALVQNLVVWH